MEEPDPELMGPELDGAREPAEPEEQPADQTAAEKGRDAAWNARCIAARCELNEHVIAHVSAHNRVLIAAALENIEEVFHPALTQAELWGKQHTNTSAQGQS